MSDSTDCLDGGRKRMPSERLAAEFGLEHREALRFVSLARGDLDKARRLANGETVDAVMGPMVGPLIAYDPRCTGPIPEGLTPFGTFMHRQVQVSPALARELAGWAGEGRSTSWLRVDDLRRQMIHPKQRWVYSPDHRVTVDDRGQVVEGLHLLLAIVQARRVIELDVWHNFPGEEWARIEQGRRRPPADSLTFSRPRRTDHRRA